MYMEISAMIYHSRIAIGEFPNALRKIGRGWHCSSVNQNWNNDRTSVQRGFNFDTNRVIIILNPRPVSAEPARSNDCKHNGCFSKLPLNMFSEVNA